MTLSMNTIANASIQLILAIIVPVDCMCNDFYLLLFGEVLLRMHRIGAVAINRTVHDLTKAFPAAIDNLKAL